MFTFKSFKLCKISVVAWFFVRFWKRASFMSPFNTSVDRKPKILHLNFLQPFELAILKRCHFLVSRYQILNPFSYASLIVTLHSVRVRRTKYTFRAYRGKRVEAFKGLLFYWQEYKAVDLKDQLFWRRQSRYPIFNRLSLKSLLWTIV